MTHTRIKNVSTTNILRFINMSDRFLKRDLYKIYSQIVFQYKINVNIFKKYRSL